MTRNHEEEHMRANGGSRPRERGWRWSRRRVAVAAVVILGGLALAACSSSGASTTTTTDPSGGGSSGAPGGFGGGGSGGRQIPGASGTIASVSGSSMEVQGSDSQTTVTYTSSTTINETVSSSASSITSGVCVSAFGKPTSGSSNSSEPFGGPITATSVTISQPTSGTCSSGFGGGAGSGGAGGAPPGGGEFSGRTPPSSFPKGRKLPSGFGSFGAASGMVTAVSGSTVTVQETTPQGETPVAVTLTSSTTYSQTQSASASVLVVGQCARAFGTSSSTGAIAADSITVSSPGSNGCSSGGGFPGGPGGGPGGTNGA